MARKPVYVTSPDSFNETRLKDADKVVYEKEVVDVVKPEVVDPVKKDADTHKSTHKPTHNSTHENKHVPDVLVKNRKTRRVQILTYDSLINRMDKVAKKYGVSRVDVFEAAMEKYLADQGE